MLNEVFDDAKDRMEKTLKTLEQEYKRLRTGRASPALLEGIKVEYYGTMTPLNQLATISVPEARTIVVQPWDQNVIGEIEKAILKSDLGLNPSNDGKIIRVHIPPLTQQRRQELVKHIRKMAEEAKVAVLNIRRDANEMLKDLKKEKQISEDEQFRAQEQIQKLTDDNIKKIDQIFEKKEKEIMEF